MYQVHKSVPSYLKCSNVSKLWMESKIATPPRLGSRRALSNTPRWWRLHLTTSMYIASMHTTLSSMQTVKTRPCCDNAFQVYLQLPNHCWGGTLWLLMISPTACAVGKVAPSYQLAGPSGWIGLSHLRFGHSIQLLARKLETCYIATWVVLCFPVLVDTWKCVVGRSV